MSSISAPLKDIEPDKLLFSINTLSLSFNASLLEIAFVGFTFPVWGVSGVLTAALTESTPKYCVGRTVAYRSILGIGFGSITPAVFGFIIDITNNHQPINSETNWIFAFSFLGVAGLIATFCASKFKS